MVEVVLGRGRSERVETVDDHQLNFGHADAVLDRVYGKATAPVQVSQPDDDRFERMSDEELDRYVRGSDEGLRLG